MSLEWCVCRFESSYVYLKLELQCHGLVLGFYRWMYETLAGELAIVFGGKTWKTIWSIGVVFLFS